MNEEVLTAEEVAEFLKVKPTTIYQWVAKRTIPFHRVGGTLRFLKSEIIERIKQGE